MPSPQPLAPTPPDFSPGMHAPTAASVTPSPACQPPSPPTTSPTTGPSALVELRSAVREATTWRLAAQYAQITRELPGLLAELSRAFHASTGRERAELAELLVTAYRSADAVAYKFGAHDLSARLIELMRWAVPEAGSTNLESTVAYVRTETFFAARAHAPGLTALEHAVDQASASRARMRQRPVARFTCGPPSSPAEQGTRAQRPPTSPRHEPLATASPKDLPRHCIRPGLREHSRGIGRCQPRRRPCAACPRYREGVEAALRPASRATLRVLHRPRPRPALGRARGRFLRIPEGGSPHRPATHARAPWARDDAATLRRLKRADSESSPASPSGSAPSELHPGNTW